MKEMELKLMKTTTWPTSFLQYAIVILGFLVLPGVVMAHTGLKSSNPEDGAVMNRAPEELHLTFTALVALVRLSVTDEAGRQLELDFKPSADRGTEFHIPVPAAAVQAGNLKVEWAVIGEDGHTVSDAFSYVVDSSASTDSNHTHGADHQHNPEHHAAQPGTEHEHNPEHHAAHHGGSQGH